jgi:hypothetical protein
MFCIVQVEDQSANFVGFRFGGCLSKTSAAKTSPAPVSSESVIKRVKSLLIVGHLNREGRERPNPNPNALQSKLFKHSVITALAGTVVIVFYKNEGYPATEQTLCIDREIPSLRIR